MTPTPAARPRVLQVGLDPDVVDFSAWPGQSAQTLRQRISAARDELGTAGLDVDLCLVGVDPQAAGATVCDALTDRTYDVVEIGAGLRLSAEHTEVFEEVVAAVVSHGAGARLCFNTSPDTTLAAVRRALAR